MRTEAHGLARRRVAPRPTELQVSAIAFGLATLGVYAGLASWQTIDFRTFYDAGLGFRHGTSLHTLQPGDFGFNLNPPTFAVLMVPWTFLAYPVALGVWIGLQVVLVADLIRRIVGRVGRAPVWWMVAGVVATAPAQLAWLEGQIIWPLAYLVTRAWLADSPARSGLWLAVAIALKPPLALVPLLLGWRICLVAGAGSLGLTLAAVAITGWGPWAEWLSLHAAVNWITLIHNVSLWGLLGRLSLRRLYDVWLVTLPGWIAFVVLGAGLLSGLAIWRHTAGDRRWTLAIYWHLWLSPAGWIYYLPLALGPAVASWPRSRWAVVGVGVMAIPDPVLYALSHTPTGQWTWCSVYGFGMLALLWAWGPAWRR